MRVRSVLMLAFVVVFLGVMSFIWGLDMGGQWVESLPPSSPSQEVPLHELTPASIPATVPPTSAPVPTSSPPSPGVPLGPTALVQVPVSAVPQEVSDADRLTVCLNLPCEVYSEDWEWRGFSARAINLMTEKYTFTQTSRAQCERVLVGAAQQGSRKATKKLDCLRTRHREAQCALLQWNRQEALPVDANSQMVMRSAVALNLLLDFHLNEVKHPQRISLCLGDVAEQYSHWVMAEATAYQAAYNEEPLHYTELDVTFCAEQRQEVSLLLALDEFNRSRPLSGFSFPSFPPAAAQLSVMESVCHSVEPPLITVAQ